METRNGDPRVIDNWTLFAGFLVRLCVFAGTCFWFFAGLSA
jgi:hypothetical protein